MNKFKIIIYYLIAVNIGIYLLMSCLGVSLIDPGAEELFRWGGSSSYSLAKGQWWRLITSMFVHSGIFHLLMNMYALFSIGPILEVTLGKRRLLFAYFSTGILAALASCLFHANIPTISVGASGAIFGLFGVLLALLTTRFFVEEVRDALIGSFGITVAMNIAYSFRAGIDFAAHIGGFLSGLFIGYCLYLTFAFPKKSLTIGVYSLIAIIVLGGSSLSIQHLKNGDSFVFYELKDKIAVQHKEIGDLLSPLSKMQCSEGMHHLEKVIIPKLEEAKKTAKQMGQLHLSKEQEKYQQFVDELYSLQIESFQLMVKSVKEDTSLDESRLNEIAQRCKELVKSQSQ